MGVYGDGPAAAGTAALAAARTRVEIERLGHHLERAIGAPRPVPLWTIPVELDTIPIGIAQIEGFADAVVAGAFEWNACLIEPKERLAERRAIRIPDREVIQTGRSSCGRLAAAALPCVETDVMVIAAGAEKRRAAPHPLGDVESEDPLVEGQRAIEIRDFQVHVADIDPWVDGIVHGSLARDRSAVPQASALLFMRLPPHPRRFFARRTPGCPPAPRSGARALSRVSPHDPHGAGCKSRATHL